MHSKYKKYLSQTTFDRHGRLTEPGILCEKTGWVERRKPQQYARLE